MLRVVVPQSFFAVFAVRIPVSAALHPWSWAGTGGVQVDRNCPGFACLVTDTARLLNQLVRLAAMTPPRCLLLPAGPGRPARQRARGAAVLAGCSGSFQ